MLFRNTSKNPDDFWRDYEEKTGEKVLARCLGQYMSGWGEFENLSGIWGLVIFTSGGFRFHHFPQIAWFQVFSRISASEAPKEKTIFVPKENITGMSIFKETKWWKKLSRSMTPLKIQCRDDAGVELQLVLNIDPKTGDSKVESFVENMWAENRM